MRAFPATAEDLITWKLWIRLVLWLRNHEWRFALVGLLLVGLVLVSAKSFEALTWCWAVTDLGSPELADWSQAYWTSSLLNYGCTLLLAVTGLSALLLTIAHLRKDVTKVRPTWAPHRWTYLLSFICIAGLVFEHVREYGRTDIGSPFWWIAALNFALILSTWERVNSRILSPVNILLIHASGVLWLYWVFFSMTIGHWVGVTQ